jgi:hypothetical protein
VGYDLIAVAFFVLLTPLVVAGFIVFWVVNARDHADLAACWRRYAVRRGLDFVAPSGEWPNRSGPAMSWRDGEATARLSVIGREARVRTRLTVRPRSTLLGALSVVSDETAAGQLTIRERPVGFAERVLDARVRRALLGFRQRESIMLTYRRGRVILEWPGGELNDARLDAAREVATQISSTIAEQFLATSRAAARKPAA